MENSAQKRTAAVLIVIAGCLWGTMGLFVRYLSVQGLDSMQICTVRSILTAVLLTAALGVFKPALLKVRLRDLWCFAGTGIASVLFFNYCYFKCMSVTSLSVAAVLLYTAPFFVIVFSYFLFKEKIGLRKTAALVLAFLGCVLVSGVFSQGEAVPVSGLLLGLCAGVGYALYSVFSRYALQRGYHSLTVTAYTFLFAAAGGALITDFTPIAQAVGAAPAATLGFYILFAAVSTLLPYICYTKGLGAIENGTASVLASVEPVVATVIGIFVFHEALTLSNAAGMALVLTGMVILNPVRRGKRKAQE